MFHRGFKHSKIIKALGLRPRAFISFLVFETPMKHSHSFLKYYIKHDGHLKTQRRWKNKSLRQVLSTFFTDISTFLLLRLRLLHLLYDIDFTVIKQ